jgi:phytoene dehydrogenase-like protein
MTNNSPTYDAVVIGSGPNGLASAITLAQQGWRVLVLEAYEKYGGGMRSAELTLPGFTHDVCSSVHPLGVGSPFFRSLPLQDFDLEWVQPAAPLAHPFDGGQAVVLDRSLAVTAEQLDGDGEAYLHLMKPLVENWQGVLDDFLGPLPLPPKHPFLAARLGLHAVQPAAFLARHTFHGAHARGLFAGLAGHSILPLETPVTAGFALLIGMMAHAVGWPVARHGSQSIADALARYLQSMGGEIENNCEVRSLRDLPPARAYLFDLTPRQLLKITGEAFPASYRRKLGKFRYGSGIYKIDYALSGPVPWLARGCELAATVHLGGTLEEIAASEAQVGRGEHPAKPFVLFVQASNFDSTRAPQGKHTAWAYCHVPNGSTVDMTGPIEDQLERFAPGFRELILARYTRDTAQLEAYNANYVGGDIIGGTQDLFQQFFRPVASLNPYRTPLKGVYLCSSSTPPGGGVHGMCGYFAAQCALKDLS